MKFTLGWKGTVLRRCAESYGVILAVHLSSLPHSLHLDLFKYI